MQTELTICPVCGGWKELTAGVCFECYHTLEALEDAIGDGERGEES